MSPIVRKQVSEFLDAALAAAEQTSLNEWIAITQERARNRGRRSTALAWLVNATLPEVRRQIRGPTPEHEAHKANIQAAFRRAMACCATLPEAVEVGGATWPLREHAMGVTADLVRAVGNAPFVTDDKKATDALKLLLKPFVRFPQYERLATLYETQ